LRRAADPGPDHMKIIAQMHEIGAIASGDPAQLMIKAEEPCRIKRGHAQGFFASDFER
jgi:hypothetical protein